LESGVAAYNLGSFPEEEGQIDDAEEACEGAAELGVLDEELKLRQLRERAH